MLTMDVQIPSFLTLAIGTNSGQIQAPATFASWEASPVTFGEGWVGPVTGLDILEKIYIPCLCRRSDRDIWIVQP